MRGAKPLHERNANVHAGENSLAAGTRKMDVGSDPVRLPDEPENRIDHECPFRRGALSWLCSAQRRHAQFARRERLDEIANHIGFDCLCLRSLWCSSPATFGRPSQDREIYLSGGGGRRGLFPL